MAEPFQATTGPGPGPGAKCQLRDVEDPGQEIELRLNLESSDRSTTG